MGVSVVFLPPRLLRRVIRRHRRISRFGRDIPHAGSYQLRGELLKRLVPSADLQLHAHVIMIAEPEEEAVPPDWLWRKLFHERVHSLYREARLSSSAVRERIHQIGQVEFDEIRLVLRKEDLLLPSRGRAERLPEAYGEFLATHLELKYFDPPLLSRYFPGLELRGGEIDDLVARDLDAERLYSETRPVGCPDPVQREEPEEEEEPASPEIPDSARAGTFRRRAEAARARGNRVGAALAFAGAGVSSAVEVGSLSRDLSGLTGLPADRWADALSLLVARGFRNRVSRSTRLLFDLQKACVDHATPPHRVDIVEPLLRLGRLPVRRPLEALREVLPLKHFRKGASRKLPEEITRLLDDSLVHLEEKVRVHLRPLVQRAVSDSALPRERIVSAVGSDKMVEELLDEVIAKGFFTFGELRDAVARNQARLNNLSGPAEFFGGDPLLRMDRALARPLEGVYRRGEIYLRWLQRFSSLFFGTRTGRFLVRYAIMPFGGAFVLLEGMQHLAGPVIGWFGGGVPGLLNRETWIALGLFFMAMISLPGFRRGVATVLRGAKRAGAMVMWDAPAWILRLRPLLWFRRSWLWFTFVRYGFRPAFLSLLVGWPLLLLDLKEGMLWYAAPALFFVVNVGLNTLLGRMMEERAEDWLIRGWRHFAAHLLPNLSRWTLETFRLLLEGLEKLLYRVDESLRFRPGDHVVAVWGKAALGAGWFVVTYFIRIYINVLVEPQVNPIKHFPVVTVSHKIILPMSVTLVELMRTPLLPLGSLVADGIAVMTVFLLPGMFGFLVWEWKESWRLYRENRSRNIEPVEVGHHGESVPRLLRPGFHSGSIPKAFSRLRRKQRKGKAGRKMENLLREHEEAVRRFVEREFVALMKASPRWEGEVGVGEVRLTSNSIRVSLPGHGELSFEEQSGWTVAGWRGGEPDPVFRFALEGLYRLAGVDLVRGQVERALPANVRYDVISGGIVVWPGSDFHAEIFYPLKRLLPWSRPRYRKSEVDTPPPPVRTRELVFRKTPLRWSTWEEWWETPG